MAGREPAAQASGRDLRVGGLCRFLSRAQPQRRHLQHLRAELVRHAGQDRAVRARHQGPPQPHEWRLGVGTGDAHRRRDGRQPLRSRQDLFRASARRRLLQGDVAGLVEGQGAAALGRELGRPAAASARQFRGLLPRRRRSRNGSKCTASSIGRTTTPTTASSLQKKFFGYFLKGEKNGWDKQPRVQLNVRHPGEKFVIRHEDDWPLPQHAMDQVSSRRRRAEARRRQRRKARRQ